MRENSEMVSKLPVILDNQRIKFFADGAMGKKRVIAV